MNRHARTPSLEDHLLSLESQLYAAQAQCAFVIVEARGYLATIFSDALLDLDIWKGDLENAGQPLDTANQDLEWRKVLHCQMTRIQTTCNEVLEAAKVHGPRSEVSNAQTRYVFANRS